MVDFVNLVSKSILLCDGAMGTMLRQLTGTAMSCIDACNLHDSWSEQVAAVHRMYKEAGANILQTNTFGANRVKLAFHARQDDATSINWAGVDIARAVAGNDCLVAGSVGPLELLRWDERYNEEFIRAVYAEQMDALVGAGADLLLLETFQDELEAVAAVKQAKTYGVPVVFQLGGFQNGRTSSGADVATLMASVDALGADVLGANCRSPYDVLEAVRLIASVSAKPISAQPNAGTPRIDRAQVVYDMGPEQLAAMAREYIAAGATLVGSCCGSTPDHTRALHEAVRALQPAERRPPTRVMAAPTARPRAERSAGAVNPLRERIRQPGKLISVEVRPSRGEPMAAIIDGAKALAAAGAELFDVPDNAGAQVARDAMACAALLQQHTHVPAIIHKASTQANLLSIQSYLLGAWELGIRGVLAVTGDHPEVGDHDKYASRVTDLKSSVELIQLIRLLNGGALFNNEPLAEPTDFVIACGYNPTRSRNAQLKWLERKIDAGAELVFTQPIYRVDDAYRMKEDTARLGARVLAGVLPIVSLRNARFLAAGRIPGISVPDELIERFARLEQPSAQRALGMSLARDLVERLRDVVDGFYFILPFGKDKYAATAELVRLARGEG